MQHENSINLLELSATHMYRFRKDVRFIKLSVNIVSWAAKLWRNSRENIALRLSVCLSACLCVCLSVCVSIRDDIKVTWHCFVTFLRHDVFWRYDKLFDERFEVMTNFSKSWCTFCRHDELFDVMIYLWHHDELVDVMTYFWRHDELMTSTNFLTSWRQRVFWRHDGFLTSWRIFWHHEVFLTLW